MDASQLDNSLSSAQKDHATVTPDGARVEHRIDGVIVSSPVNHVDHRGRVVRSVFDAYWAKVDWDEAAPRGGKLLLKSRGRTLEIGRHFTAPEKAELADALRTALARARRPDFDNPQLREP